MQQSQLSVPQRIAAKLLRQREQNRDRCVRLTWIMRRLVREQGRRLTAQGRIDAPDDLFHLTLGVLIDPPEGVRETVARRKAEREKLKQLHMPPIFAEKWQAAEVLKPLGAGRSSAVSASAAARSWAGRESWSRTPSTTSSRARS
ncbi:hypothetical protein ACUY3U_07405 [Gordonia amicalis]